MHLQGNQFRIGKLTTSKKELNDMLKAWIAISAAFAIAITGSFNSPGFYLKFISAAFTVGLGFLLHEIGHKIMAQKYGCFAEFRSFDNMLVLALLMSFFGFIFAAPGAVMIAGKVTRRKNGMISAAGPAVNLVLSLIFLGIFFMPAPDFVKLGAYYGFIVNAWLALFNMIPFWLFDGRKIWEWSRPVYFSITAIAVIFMVLQGFIGLPYPK